MSHATRQVRRATQLLLCRAVLTKYLTGEELERALIELRNEMRSGVQSWAFKPLDVAPPDDRIYYETGGAT